MRWEHLCRFVSQELDGGGRKGASRYSLISDSVMELSER